LRRIRLLRPLLLLPAVGLLAACSTTDGEPQGGPEPPQAPSGAGCRGDADDPQPGDVICFSGELDEPLRIDAGGTPAAPIVYTGNGQTTVPGIRAKADNIVIQGFTSEDADSTGIWVSGTNITVQDNTITQVHYDGDDVDGIRFFGSGTKLLRNHVYDLEANDIEGSHVDCMQTFATSGPGSENVVIQGNRCEEIRAQCLMAEGPNDEGGSGEGVSRNWLFEDNYCDSYADAQSVALEDIQNVTIRGNEMVGKATKAFALGKGSTGIIVQDNEIGPDYGREVGFDDPSAQVGYQGPPAS
jgi:Right handed beta helix region